MKIDGKTGEEFVLEVMSKLAMGSNPETTLLAAIELAYYSGYSDATGSYVGAATRRLQKAIDDVRAERNASRKVN